MHSCNLTHNIVCANTTNFRGNATNTRGSSSGSEKLSAGADAGFAIAVLLVFVAAEVGLAYYRRAHTHVLDQFKQTESLHVRLL